MLFMCAYPLYYVLIQSLSGGNEGTKALLLPINFTFNNFHEMLTIREIGNAILISVVRTVLGTVSHVFCCMMLGYLYTKDTMPFRKVLYRFMVITMYVGGGIIPDVFVPVDTTRASAFFVACNKKATQMRFASEMFDRYRDKLSPVESFDDLIPLLDGMDLPKRFRTFAQTRDGITATDQEWEETLPYLEPQLRALVGRYSRLGENAFYKLYEEIDTMLQAAIRQGT